MRLYLNKEDQSLIFSLPLIELDTYMTLFISLLILYQFIDEHTIIIEYIFNKYCTYLKIVCFLK